MRTFLKIIVSFLCLASCNDQGEKIKSTTSILEDWFSFKNNSYMEYHFDEYRMSTHGLSRNIYSYNYHLVNGNNLKLVDDSGNKISHYFGDIVKVDSFEIVFKNLTLHRLNEENTLGSYANKEIELDSLSFYFLQRNAAAVPIDSLLKVAGDPIDVDELFEEVK